MLQTKLRSKVKSLLWKQRKSNSATRRLVPGMAALAERNPVTRIPQKRLERAHPMPIRELALEHLLRHHVMALHPDPRAAHQARLAIRDRSEPRSGQHTVCQRRFRPRP